MIEEIVGFAENLEPIALIGAGGIGKTSIALAVLHHDRIKARFGDNRRFIRCDQFSASRVYFLARLSQAVGAGVQNPEDLTPLRPFLSSREMILFLDNAESILDPQGTDSQEIHAVVEELSRFENICLGITSRISTVPPHCKRPTVPTLSMESAIDIFYAIYNNDGRSGIISDLIKQLDFHALSITLLGTTASHNAWDHDRLAKEWTTHRVGILQADYNKSLAVTIELSLASPTFRQLIPPSKSHKLVDSPTVGKLIPSPILRKIPPSARELLEVVAFFPQGVDEKNLDWLFPTTSNRQNIFDAFCVLSLTHRNDGFITMLSPIRDYLRPLDPKCSPLLRTTKDRYFTRLSAIANSSEESLFKKSPWIKLEDVNIEHLLNVFTSIDTNASDVWKACGHFIKLLHWLKPRQTVLGPKIEGLPDDHRSKAGCLFHLARLFGKLGNNAEEKRLLTHTLSLQRGWWNYPWAAETTWYLSDANRRLGLYKEGIQQAEELLKMSKRFRVTWGQIHCLKELAWLFLDDGQLDAAENAALQMVDLIPGGGQEFELAQSHRVLGEIYCQKGEKEKSIDHYKTSLRIATTFDWQHHIFDVHQALADLFLAEDKLDDANTHVKQAKSHAVDDPYFLGCAMKLQAQIQYRQRRLEDARFEALGALEVFEKLGAAKDAGDCRELLQEIEQAVERRTVPDESDCSGEFSRYNAAPDPC